MDSGQWTVNSRQGTVDSGQWTVDSGQWTVDSGQWTVVPWLERHITGPRQGDEAAGHVEDEGEGEEGEGRDGGD